MRCGVALGIAIALAAPTARAEEGRAVVRGEGAALCPEGAELARMAIAAGGRAAPSPAHTYRVVFDRGALYRAEIVDVTAHRTRTLEDAGPTCAALAQA